MKCPHCDSEWSIQELECEEKFEYPDKCPFCGCSRVAFADDCAHVLKQIIEQKGKDILLNRKVLIGLVADLMNANPKEQNTLKIIINEGVGELFYNMVGADSYYINIQKHKIIHLITEDIGMRLERAEFVMKTFMFALDLEKDASIIGTKEKNFHDSDNAYFNLAEKYMLDNKMNIAEKLFYLSSDSGNVSAIHRTIFLVREKNWIPNDKSWLEWHKVLTDVEDDNYESAYVLAMSYTYGLNDTKNFEIAKPYWEKGKRYNEIAGIEYMVRQFLGYFPLFNINIVFYRLQRLALGGHSLAKEIYDFLENTGNGIDGWKHFFIDSEKILDMIYDAEFYENKKYQMAIIMGDYYSSKIQEIHNHSDFDYEIITLTWYLIAAESDENEIKFSAAKKMLKSSWIISRRYAVEILEDIRGTNEAKYLLGIEYLKGETVEKNYKKAYELLNNSVGDESDYLLGQLKYYGWGVEADLSDAIKYFEEEIKKYVDLHDLKEVNDEFILLKCISFLIQCYYEDIVLRDSVISLEKLKLLADYHGWKNAARFLYWYFSDSDNLYQDPDEARHYYKIMVKNTSIPIYVNDCHKQEIMTEQFCCSCMQSCYNNTDFFSVKDHVLWSHGRLPIKTPDFANAILGTSTVRPYYYLAVAFAHGIGVSKNIVRAEMYVRLYIELTENNPDKKIYPKALRLMIRLLKNNNSQYRKKLQIINYTKKLIDFKSTLNKKERMNECLNEAKKCMNKGKFTNALLYAEEAVENGFNKDYSYIGLFYLSGAGDIKVDYDKGFWWLKKFYDDYRDFELDLDENYEDIARVEYNLGICYMQGLGTETNKKEAEKLWKLALEHCSDRMVDLIVILSSIFYEGECEFNSDMIYVQKNKVLAVKGFNRAAQLGSSDAMFYLGEIYENENNMEKALEWYQKAKEAEI